MPAAHRVGDIDNGLDRTVTGSPNVFTNSRAQVRVGDIDFDPSKSRPGERSGPDRKTTGSPNVFVNSRALHRLGDLDSDMDRSITGSPNVFANG